MFEPILSTTFEYFHTSAHNPNIEGVGNVLIFSYDFLDYFPQAYFTGTVGNLGIGHSASEVSQTFIWV